jgi:hypothetical protein
MESDGEAQPATRVRRTRLGGWYIHREDILSIRLLRSRKAWVMLATGGTATVT